MQYSEALSAVVIEQVRARFPQAVKDPLLARNLEQNFASMLQDARARYSDSGSSSIVSDAFLDPEHLATGALHAEQTQHPAGAMLAAEMLFDAYLPVFVQEVGAVEPSEVVAAARALHAGIWARFPAGAVAYTEALRQRASTAHLDSRTQIARDLHDRIAHAIIAGMQRVDLVLLTDAPAESTAVHLRDAARLMRDALGEVQDLAVALHARVGDDLLDAAVSRHVADLFPRGAAVTVQSQGTPESMPSWKSEEVLTIVLEALTNWRKHAPGSRAEVQFVWSGDEVVVTVRDDGPGFDVDQEPAGRLGRRTMRERAAIIGARLSVTSRSGDGTSVVLTVPMDSL